MILLLLMAASAAAAIGPEELGRVLARTASRAGVASVSVQAFATPDAASAETGRDASDAVVRGLLSEGKVRVVERDGLPAVLKERALGASTGDAPPALAAGDAVLVGTLRRAREGWTASARVVRAADGEIAAGGEAFVASAPAAPPLSEDFPPVGALVDAAHALAATYDEPALERLAVSGAAPDLRRAAAVLALADAGDAELPLADALRDREPVVRFAAAMAVGRGVAPWAEGALRRMLRGDPSWSARFAAAQALSRYASDASAGDLREARRSDASWRVRRQAASSLAARVEAEP